MIVDTSALIAILKGEPDAERLQTALINANNPIELSAASYLEAGIVVDRNGNDTLSARLDELLNMFAITIAPVTEAQVRRARAAYRHYGKGTGHPAGLNFGDCFSYARAMEQAQPLLFKGADFGATDVMVA